MCTMFARVGVVRVLWFNYFRGLSSFPVVETEMLQWPSGLEKKKNVHTGSTNMKSAVIENGQPD